MLLLLTSVALAFTADQLSKRAAHCYTLVRCTSWLQIRHVRHDASLYRKPAARASLLLLWCVSLASALTLQSSGVWLRSPAALLGVGFALGGAAGNLTDILRRQHVIDFIDLSWWPVFNLADVAIVGGLLLAFASTAPQL